MTTGFLLVAFGYLLLALGVWAYEAKRIRRARADLVTIFLVVCLLQTCLAGIAIFGLLPFTDPSAPVGNTVFDRIFQEATLTSAFLVLCLTAWFVVWLYAGCALARLALPARTGSPGRWRLGVHTWRLAAVLIFGLLLTLYSFHQLGDDLVSRYANLILFRDLSASVPRTALNANAFTLTQTWAWLSVVALFFLAEQKHHRALKLVSITMLIVFALLGASRRSLFLPVLLAYLGSVLQTGRWRVAWLMLLALPVVVWLAFGKEVLAAIAFGHPLFDVADRYGSLASGILRAASEVGITIVESLGTMTYLPDQLRLGMDHLLSLAQRFPEGMLGFDIDWPQRMVRVSTEAFAGAEALDIPPGFAGQMWIDFRLLGPVVWGLLMGLQVGMLQWLFDRTEKRLGAAMVAVLLIFIVALPINTGSFDFTFSVNIIVLVLVLWWCLRLAPAASCGRGPLGGGEPVSKVSATQSGSA